MDFQRLLLERKECDDDEWKKMDLVVDVRQTSLFVLVEAVHF
jgi:hypothetical protein